MPSHEPTSLPSSNPSGLPSVQPSCVPSGMPSSHPTIDHHNAYTATLSNWPDLLRRRNHTDRVFSAVVNSAGDTALLNSNWLEFVSIFLDTPFILDYYELVILTRGMRPFDHQEFHFVSRCGDSAITNDIFDLIVAASSGGTEEKTCDGVTSLAGRRSLCWNCGGTSRCSDPANGVIALPEASYCHNEHPHNVTKFSVAVLFYNREYVYDSVPKIVNMSLTTSQQTITVNASVLSTYAGGTLYCRPYRTSRYSMASVTGSFIKAGGFSTPIRIARDDIVEISMVLTDLVASRDYTVFCYIEDAFGNGGTKKDILASKRQVRTACCRGIVLTESPSSVKKGHSAFFTYSIPTFPSSETALTVTVGFYRNGVKIANIAASPGTHTYSTKNRHAGLSRRFSIVVSSGAAFGEYSLVLSLSGSASSLYQPPPPFLFVLLNESSVLPAPLLTSARFADSGGYVIACFDKATDYAITVLGSATSTSWPCSKVLSFTGSAHTSCAWTSDRCVRMTFCGSNVCANVPDRTALPLLQPGESVAVKENTIMSSCGSDSISSCSTFLYSSFHSISVDAPILPLEPLVYLSSFKRSTLCDTSLVIDPSATFGSGGRSWRSTIWAVESVGDSDVTDILAKLNAAPISSPILIPFEYLQPTTYTFTLHVTNFLGLSAFASVDVHVSSDVYALELFVTIDGPIFRDVYAYEEFTATAVATLPQCSSVSAVSYTWKVYKNTLLLDEIVSTSADPRVMKLPPYSLQPGETFYFLVTAVTDEGKKGSALLEVPVKVGSTYVAIRGADRLLVPAGAPVNLDATASVQEDINPALNNAVTLSWSCSMTNTSFETNVDDNCSHLIDVEGYENISSATVVPVRTYGMYAGTEYTFTATAINSDDEAVPVSASVSVVVVPDGSGHAPLVEMLSSFSKFLSPETLRVSGKLSGLKAAVLANWSLYDDSGNELSLAGIITTPFSKKVENASATHRYTLSILPNTLTSGRTYSFRLTAVPLSGPRFETYAELIISANGPPFSGAFVVSPPEGQAMTTRFTLNAPFWVDDISDYPISYTFRYSLQSSSATLLLLGLSSQRSYAQSLLPAGLDNSSGMVYCSVLVSDFFGASTQATTIAIVRGDASGGSNVTELSMRLSNAKGSGNSGTIMQTINAASSDLAVSDCSKAPDCVSLNRRSCDKTPHTCSECLIDFIGVEGHSNTRCDSALTVSPPSVGEFCSHHKDCTPLLCIGGFCREMNKTCPSISGMECSGAGQCLFYDKATDLRLSECLTDNGNCVPRCNCDNDRFGSACSLSLDEYTNRALSRVALCDSLSHLIGRVDWSSELMLYVSAALRQTFKADEVASLDGLSSCLSVLEALTNISDAGHLTNNELYTDDGSSSTQQNIMDTISEFLNFIQRSDKSLQGEDIETLVNHTVAALNAMIESMTARISSDMVGGEATLEIISSGVRLSVTFSDANDLHGAVLRPPSIGGAAVPSIVLPASGMKACGGVGGSGDYMRLSLLEWQQNLFPSPSNDTASAKLMSRVFRFTSIGDNSPATGESSFSNATLSTTYELIMQYTSAQNWTYKGPDCALYDGNGKESDCPCDVVSFDEYEVHFLCYNLLDLCPVANARRRALTLDVTTDVGVDNPLYAYKKHIGRRRLDFDYEGEADDDGGADTSRISEYGALVKSLESEFISNLGMPRSFDVEDALPVLSCIAAVVLLFLIGMVLFAFWDEKDYNYVRYVLANVNRGSGSTKEKKFDLTSAFISNRSAFDATDMSGGGVGVHKGANAVAIAKDEPTPKNWANVSTESFESDSTSRAKTVVVRSIGEASPLTGNCTSTNASNCDSDALGQGVSSFFDNALPPSSLLESKSGWLRFWQAILREHNWIRCFTYPSLRLPRVIRYLTICTELMIILFVDSLFYGILFEDDGSCEEMSGRYGHTEEECLSVPSRMQSSLSRCVWHEETSVCELRPPPSTIQFYMVVSIMITLISVIPNVICSILLSDICTLRPKFTFAKSYDIDDCDHHRAMTTRRSELGRFMSAQNGIQPTEVNEQDEVFACIEHMTVEEEANFLLDIAEKTFRDSLKNCALPWRIENLTSDHDYDTVDHARKFIGVYPDGTPIPLTWMQRLTFGTPRKRIERKLKAVRRRVQGILGDMEMFVEGEEDCKDTLLIQNFILEQLSPFKRYALRHEFFQIDTAVPGFVNGYAWLMAWAFIVMVWIFLIYWVILWALNNSDVTVNAWAYQIVFVIIQEIFINELLQIFIVNVVVIEVLRPQLRRIYFALNTVIVSKMTDVVSTDRRQGKRENLRVVQHMSASCRAARKHPELPAAQLLMRVDDNDAALCQHNRDISLGWLMSMIIVIPTLLALSHETIQQGIMDIIFPTMWCCFLLGNAYLYSISPILLAGPYALLLLYICLRYCYFLPKRHRNMKRLQGIETEEDGPSHIDVTWKNMNLSMTLAGDEGTRNADIYREYGKMLHRRMSIKSGLSGDLLTLLRTSLSQRRATSFADEPTTDTGPGVTSTPPVVVGRNVQPLMLVGEESTSEDDSTDDRMTSSADTQHNLKEMPDEIRAMKVHVKSKKSLGHREKHSKKRGSRLVNKYVWGTHMGNKENGDTTKREGVQSMDMRPFGPLDEPTNTPRLSLSRITQYTKRDESLQLRGLGTLRQGNEKVGKTLESPKEAVVAVELHDVFVNPAMNSSDDESAIED